MKKISLFTFVAVLFLLTACALTPNKKTKLATTPYNPIIFTQGAEELTPQEVSDLDVHLKDQWSRFISAIEDSRVEYAVAFLSESIRQEFRCYLQHITPEQLEALKDIDLMLFQASRSQAVYEDQNGSVFTFVNTKRHGWKIKLNTRTNRLDRSPVLEAILNVLGDVCS